MAQLKPRELENLTADELKEKANGLKKELFSLRLQAKSGKLNKHTTIRFAKRDMARVLTFLKQKEKV